MMDYWYPLAWPTIGEEEIEAVVEVLRSRNTTMGQKVKEFEEAFAQYVGARHAVMVNSGSSADLLIAIGSGIRGEVLIPAVTWPTHYWAWKIAGCQPQLIDVDGLNVSAATVERGLSVRTEAISLVHLMGAPCNMEAIIDVIGDRSLYEDCCEALGSHDKNGHVGHMGHAAAWSFFFSHHITTMEGGMITTNDPWLAERYRVLREHGWARPLYNNVHSPRRHNYALVDIDPRYMFIDKGLNLRPLEVSAAIGLVQLNHFPQAREHRMANLEHFRSLLKHPLVRIYDMSSQTCPFGLPLRIDRERDDLMNCLESFGIETRPILAGNLARQPFYRGSNPYYFPGANDVHDHGLFLGLPGTLEKNLIAEVTTAINDWQPRIL